MAHFTNLDSSSAAFSAMLSQFAVVTVMNAKVYDYNTYKTIIANHNAYDIYQAINPAEPICTLETLKVANVTVDGPTKTITGGRYANTLVKYGKTARLEMQDALGNAEAIEALCGGVVEYETALNSTKIGLHVGSDFSSAKVIIGDTFFIDKNTGKQVNVVIMFYQFNPDSLFNLTQDAEGDATVFDMNGDLLTTEIKVGNNAGKDVSHSVFYSIIDPDHIDDSTDTVFVYKLDKETGRITLGKVSAETGAASYTATLDGVAVESGTTVLAENTAGRLIVKNGDTIVLDTIIQNY